MSKLNTLARSYLAAWFAMLAISLQVLFGMAHTTAMMAVAAGPLILNNPDSLSYSYLQICTANGLISFDNGALPDGASEDGSDKATDRCPVCTSAATSPFTADQGVTLCLPQAIELAFNVAPVQDLVALQKVLREPIRGPPVLS